MGMVKTVSVHTHVQVCCVWMCTHVWVCSVWECTHLCGCVMSGCAHTCVGVLCLGVYYEDPFRTPDWHEDNVEDLRDLMDRERKLLGASLI